MSRRRLQAVKCCQMTNAKAGTGSGGDRCTEACAAIIDATYKIGPWSKDGQHSVEQIMYQFTEMLNAGSDSSVPENASWITNWVSQNSNGAITLQDTVWPSFQDVVNCINRSHIAIGGFDDYASLRLIDGSNPYQWHDPPNLGHVLIIVGYDTETQAVIVHDPLRADPDGQPADYSWASFQAARFHDLVEVYGPMLPVLEGEVSMVPKGPYILYTVGREIQSGTTLQQIADSFGLTVADVKAINPWSAAYNETLSGAIDGAEVKLPGWPQPANAAEIAALQQQVAQLQAQLQQNAATLAALKADTTTVAAALTPLEVQVGSLQGAEAALQDMEKKLG